MLRKFVKVALLTVPILLVGLTAASISGAAQTANGQTITGCLQKGLEPGGFFLIAANNQHWELYQTTNVSLAGHVGQTVTVTGVSNPDRSAAQEEKSQPYEKKETGERKHADFQVSTLKVLNDTCTK